MRDGLDTEGVRFVSLFHDAEMLRSRRARFEKEQRLIYRFPR